MGGGKKVKPGGLLAEKERESKKKGEGGMFAYRIVVNYFVSDYMRFKFF